MSPSAYVEVDRLAGNLGLSTESPRRMDYAPNVNQTSNKVTV